MLRRTTGSVVSTVRTAPPGSRAHDAQSFADAVGQRARDMAYALEPEAIFGDGYTCGAIYRDAAAFNKNA